MEKRNAALIAVSVDSRDDAQELKESLGLTFPIGYGLNHLDFATQTGAFYEVRRSIIHATGFILRRDGSVPNSVYASGPIGRLWSDDCIRILDSYQNQG